MNRPERGNGSRDAPLRLPFSVTFGISMESEDLLLVVSFEQKTAVEDFWRRNGWEVVYLPKKKKKLGM